MTTTHADGKAYRVESTAGNPTRYSAEGPGIEIPIAFIERDRAEIVAAMLNCAHAAGSASRQGEVEGLREALSSIEIFGTDTLSGPSCELVHVAIVDANMSHDFEEAKATLDAQAKDRDVLVGLLRECERSIHGDSAMTQSEILARLRAAVDGAGAAKSVS